MSLAALLPACPMLHALSIIHVGPFPLQAGNILTIKL